MAGLRAQLRWLEWAHAITGARGGQPWSEQVPQENDLLRDVARILITEDELQSRVTELGQQISRDYDGPNPMLVCVLKGGYMFLADLTRALAHRHSIDFMAVSSYGNATESSGVVRILKDLDSDISGRHVLVVEDIVDTGQTLTYLLENLRVAPARQPARVHPAQQGRSRARSICTSTMSALRSPTSS